MVAEMQLIFYREGRPQSNLLLGRPYGAVDCLVA
jgi:hypothetical protein